MAAGSKANYAEIRTYVEEKARLQVSNLYIAQVKRKYGIIERANYNLLESKNSRQPKCPSKRNGYKGSIRTFLYDLMYQCKMLSREFVPLGITVNFLYNIVKKEDGGICERKEKLFVCG